MRRHKIADAPREDLVISIVTRCDQKCHYKMFTPKTADLKNSYFVFILIRAKQQNILMGSIYIGTHRLLY